MSWNTNHLCERGIERNIREVIGKISDLIEEKKHEIFGEAIQDCDDVAEDVLYDEKIKIQEKEQEIKRLESRLQSPHHPDGTLVYDIYTRGLICSITRKEAKL